MRKLLLHIRRNSTQSVHSDVNCGHWGMDAFSSPKVSYPSCREYSYNADILMSASDKIYESSFNNLLVKRGPCSNGNTRLTAVFWRDN